MEIRTRHWLLALGVATLVHAALVTAVNLQPRAPRQESAIVINLGEMGAPEDDSGGGAGTEPGAPEASAAEPVQTLAASGSQIPVFATQTVEPVKPVEPPQEQVPPPVTHVPATLDRPKPVSKPKPEPKPKPKPAVAKTSPPKPAPVTASARRDQQGTVTAAATGKAAGPTTSSARGAGLGQNPGVGTGTGMGAKGTGKGDAGTEADRGSGAGGKGIANYQGRLAAWLNRHKRYPDRARRLRQEGTVRVSFTIDRNGRLLSQRLVGGSGHPLLDQEVQAMLKRANPMPAFPAGMNQSQLTVTVPIHFSLR